jgi:hypothetical protein
MPDQKLAIRPFDQIVREINGGRLVVELTNELTDVIAAVRRSGKAGEIRLSLKLKPRGDMNQQIEVVPTVKGTQPEASRPISIFFVNDDNGLQREDPTQYSIPGLQEVMEIEQPLKKAGDV